MAKAPSIWRLICPYWFSEDKGRAWTILFTVIAANLGIVYINVRINKWNVEFYNALQKKDWHTFVSALGTFSILAFSYILLATIQIYFRQMLEIRWRRWITEDFVARWLKDNAFYRIQRNRSADNPDQRIADDLKSMVSTTLALSIDLLSTVVTLITFVMILWGLSGPLSFHLAGRPIAIPGYMVWVAVGYALVGSFVMQFFGRPLAAINYQQQCYEADFRFMLVRLRENAEQVAFYQGASAEEETLRGGFGRIRQNWSRIMQYTKRLTLVNSTYGQVAIIFPILAASPRYFSGALTLGLLFQMSNAFGQVSSSLSWFIDNYGTLASWRATMSRLREFLRAVEAPEANGIRTVSDPTGESFATDHLSLSLPGGEFLAEAGSLNIKPGSRWAIRGPSGSGKSTLLRAFATLWPFGSGKISRPSKRQLFLPQKSYLPIGTLKETLCYPNKSDAFSDDECRHVLRLCRLLPFADRLEESVDWSQQLSPGEQQRVALARVFLQEPEFLFLDEATNALDSETEKALYDLLFERLPRAAIVSVSHNEKITALHAYSIDLSSTKNLRARSTPGSILRQNRINDKLAAAEVANPGPFAQDA
jgi:putative ATP-binding cassette transporter